MLMHQAPWLGWALLLVTVGLAVAGFLFSPWLGVAAIGVDAFLVVMAMSFVIFAYGFNSVTGVNMTQHSLRATTAGLLVEFEEGDPLTIRKEEIAPYHIYPGGVIVPVGGNRAGWIWVPPRAFESDEDFKDFLKSIYRNESNTEQE